MDHIYRLFFNKFEYKVVSLVKSMLEDLEKVFLLSVVYRVIVQMFALSLIGLFTLASLFWFTVPMSDELINAMFVVFIGIFIPCSLILFALTRKRVITNTTDLDVVLKKLEAQPNFEEELIKVIIDFFTKEKQPDTELDRIRNIEKSLDAVAEALVSIQEEKKVRQIDKSEECAKDSDRVNNSIH